MNAIGRPIVGTAYNIVIIGISATLSAMFAHALDRAAYSLGSPLSFYPMSSWADQLVPAAAVVICATVGWMIVRRRSWAQLVAMALICTVPVLIVAGANVTEGRPHAISQGAYSLAWIELIMAAAWAFIPIVERVVQSLMVAE
jgi:hypothetical protein